MMLSDYAGKRVFVTGHTGFKGSWLCELLLAAGAEVYGYALAPATHPALFRQLGLAKRLQGHTLGDVRDYAALQAAMRSSRPDYVFHLAAQPLVRESYRVPRETFETNVLGTVNVLEALRRLGRGRRRPLAAVVVTTDKVYENDNRNRAFRERDPLGGFDPYSASKGACEIAFDSYRRAFFAAEASMVRVASARAGNVIGGGDWALDRIVPDAMRAFLSGRPLQVRAPDSTRPWQHVLEPLAGYLELGAALYRGEIPGGLRQGDGAFNFGPEAATVKSVRELVSELKRVFPRARVEFAAAEPAFREARLLRLDSTKAHKCLKWHPRWDFATTVRKTAEWYAAVAAGERAREVTARQLGEFFG